MYLKSEKWKTNSLNTSRDRFSKVASKFELLIVVHIYLEVKREGVCSLLIREQEALVTIVALKWKKPFPAFGCCYCPELFLLPRTEKLPGLHGPRERAEDLSLDRKLQCMGGDDSFI